MKSVLKQIIAKNKQEEKDHRLARQAEMENPRTADDRRNFLKKTALGGIAMTGMMGLGIEDTIA